MEKKLFCAIVMAFGLYSEVAAQSDSLSFKNRYEAFKKQAQREYTSFRDKANKEYAEFMETAWKSYGIQEPIKMPKRQKLEPVEYDKEKAKRSLLAQKLKLQKAKQQFSEQQKQQEEQQKKLEAQELQQQQTQQQLSEAFQQLAAAKKQLEDEKHKFLELQNQQKLLADEQRQQLDEQLKQLEKKQEQQEADQKKLEDERNRYQQEQQLYAEEKERKDTEQNKLLAAQELQQRESQKKLEEEQKKLLEAKRQLEKEQNELLAQKKQQQEDAEQQRKDLAEKQRRLDESLKKQNEQKAQLAEEQKKHEQLRKQMDEERKFQETEHRQLVNEQNKKLQEEQHKLMAEKQRIEGVRQQLLADKQKQETELKKSVEAKKKELDEQQKQLEENLQKQQVQQQRLDEEKRKYEQQKKLLVEEITKQQEKRKEIIKQEKELEEGKAIQVEIVDVKDDVRPQPQPIAPVKENKAAVVQNPFKFYGTPLTVRWGNADRFKLSGTDKKSISNAYTEFTGRNYDNLLHDCLALRKEKDLCDWAYYKMLQDVSEAACGKGTNEAVLLQGVLYQQSGYMMRFGLDDQQKLHILSRLTGTVYDRCYWIVEDNVGKRVFFLMDGSKPKKLEICDLAYPKEQTLSFNVAKLPKLDSELTEERTLESRFVSVEAKSVVNKNLIDFFNEYPATFRDNDVTTRWPYYANAPVSKEVKDKLYPQLRKRISGATKLMAANMLLNWIQMGFPYAIDEKVWGEDRAFFAEETLYYPLCDCEDRSILFSHLVRDLLGLDAVMIYFPNNPQHMYTAVCFDEDVKGDYIMVDGRKFTIADPTCYNANVGHTMNQMDNSKAKVIPLKRTIEVKSL